jgi:hypothetical protein
MKTMSPWLWKNRQNLPGASVEIQSYPSPIWETLCLAISFSSLISPPAGAFDRVRVLKSTVAGRTSDSYKLSAQEPFPKEKATRPSPQVEQMCPQAPLLRAPSHRGLEIGVACLVLDSSSVSIGVALKGQVEGVKIRCNNAFIQGSECSKEWGG